MSPDFIQWLIQETKKGNWNGEELGGAFCQLDSDNALKLATVEEELQKELAVLNKPKTCSCVPLLGSNIQHWLYQEALEGRWEQDMVFKVLTRPDVEGGSVSPVDNLGKHVVKRHQHYNYILMISRLQTVKFRSQQKPCCLCIGQI